MSDDKVPVGLDPTITRREAMVEANAVHVEKMLHRVNVGSSEAPAFGRPAAEFVVETDEPATLGGEDNHPHPVDYLAAAAAT